MGWSYCTNWMEDRRPTRKSYVSWRSSLKVRVWVRSDGQGEMRGRSGMSIVRWLITTGTCHDNAISTRIQTQSALNIQERMPRTPMSRFHISDQREDLPTKTPPQPRISPLTDLLPCRFPLFPPYPFPIDHDLFHLGTLDEFLLLWGVKEGCENFGGGREDSGVG